MTILPKLPFAGAVVAALMIWACDDGPSPIPCEPAPEECDGRDNDCDGQIDEDDSGGPLRRDCSNPCGHGVEECSNGLWEYCSAPPVMDEICNGFDDDCDGMTDEGCDCVHGTSQPCGEAIGVCGEGVQHCQNGVWGQCQYAYDPDTLEETCNDGLDNDCDGIVDEECTCAPGTTQPCGSDEGECEAGVQTCGEDSAWIEECVGAVGPTTDICDGLDNNCDGEVDAVPGFGWTGDHHEPNNECGDAAMLWNSDSENFVVEGGEVVSPSVTDERDITTYPTLYPPGDEDWFHVRTQEITGCTCWTPWCEDCAFRLGVQLWLADHALVEGAVQNPEDWRLCLNLDGCSGADTASYCTHLDDWFESDSLYQLTIIWGNGCGVGDPRDLDIRVYSPTGAACGHYQVFVWFEYDETLECPE